MKTSPRVRRHIATKAVASQRKTSPRQSAETRIPILDEESHPSCLLIYDRKDEESTCTIPLTENEFDSILERAAREGIPSRDWIAQKLRNALLIPNNDGFGDLEDNCAKASSLLELLGTKFDSIANREGSDFSGERVTHFVYGMQLIIEDAKQSLDAAFKAAWDARHPRVVALPVETGN